MAWLCLLLFMTSVNLGQGKKKENNNGLLEIPTLGRPVVLGELYSTYSEQFIPGFSLWDQETIDNNKKIIRIPSEKVEFEVGESQKEAYRHFELTASLYVSYNAGLIVVDGSARFLQTKKTMDNNAHVRMSYISRTKSESISTQLSKNKAPRCKQVQNIKGPYAPTHIVAQIIYGGNAHFDFMKEVHDGEKLQEIEGQLKVTINLKLTKIEGQAQFNMTSNEEIFERDIRISLFSDFIVPSQPTTIDETIELYKSASQYFGSSDSGYDHSVPMSVALIPIEQFCPTSELAEKISEAIFEDAVSHYLKLLQTETDIKKLLSSYAASYNTPIRKLLLDFKHKIKTFALEYGQNLAKIIPMVRSDPTNKETLDELDNLSNSYTHSCYNYETYLFDYLEKKTREVNAINIFYAETIDKPAPQISQFKEAEIAEALLTKKLVFILTLNVIPNITAELFPTEDCENSVEFETTSWYDNRTTTGDIGALWRDCMAFYKANYGVTQPGKESEYFVDIRNHEKTKDVATLHLYIDGEDTGKFQVPEIVKTKPVICRAMKGQLGLLIQNPSNYNTDQSRIIKVSVNYTEAFPEEFAPVAYKTIETTLDTTRNETYLVIEDIDSEESYKFTISYITMYGDGPPSESFYSYGPLDEMKRRPRCTMDVDIKYNSLKKVEGNFTTVSLCAEEAQVQAAQNSLPPPEPSPSSSNDSTVDDVSFGPYWWSYDIATKNCYFIDLTKKPETSETVGWISGSPACGVITKKGDDMLCHDTISDEKYCYLPYTGPFQDMGPICDQNSCIYNKVGPSSNTKYCFTSNSTLEDVIILEDDTLCHAKISDKNHSYVPYTGPFQNLGPICDKSSCIYTKVGTSSNTRYCFNSDNNLVDMDEITPLEAKMSSEEVNGTFAASNCIDHDIDSMCHTKKGVGSHPWVSLLIPKSIVRRVTITNRGDCCGDRMKNMKIWVGSHIPSTDEAEYSQGALLGSFAGPGTNGQIIEVTLQQGLIGSFVVVQMENTQLINLVQIEVFGEPAPDITTSASTTTSPATNTKPSEAVMVRRLHKSGNPDDYFAKTFNEYKTGFSSNGELWLGLNYLHRLTKGGTSGLRVTLKDWDDKEYSAVYNNFQVGPGDDYVLTIGGFDSSSSTLGDSMATHNGMKFSAKDRDVDTHNLIHCSEYRGGGGWWYTGCRTTLPTALNADVKMDVPGGGKYIVWRYGGSRGDSWDSWKEAEFTVYKK